MGKRADPPPKFRKDCRSKHSKDVLQKQQAGHLKTVRGDTDMTDASANRDVEAIRAKQHSETIAKFQQAPNFKMFWEALPPLGQDIFFPQGVWEIMLSWRLATSV